MTNIEFLNEIRKTLNNAQIDSRAGRYVKATAKVDSAIRRIDGALKSKEE